MSAFRLHDILRSTREVRRAAPAPVDDPLYQTAETDPATAPSDQGPAALYEALVGAATRVYEAAAAQDRLDSSQLLPVVEQAIASFSQDDALLTESVRQHAGISGERSWPRRAANGAILSMRLGLEIGYETRRVLGLGLCALMHDVGMLVVPDEVLNSTTRLTPEQLKLLHDHPNHSRRIVEAFGEEFAWIGAVVVQIHERQDGGGYPAGVSGDQIHEFARIIGLADTYEAMAHPRPDRAAQPVYNALSSIIDVRNSDFDPHLIRALIHIVSIFPLGSLVKLNSGAIGRVVGSNRLYPTRPLIDLLVDPQGRRLDPSRLLDLKDEPMLNIVDPAIEESVLIVDQTPF